MDVLLFGAKDPGSMTLIMLVAMFALMYFLIIRPQKNQMKARNEMLNNLAVGDKIVTVGGVTGYIRAVTEEYLYVEIADGLVIEMTRQGVNQVVSESGAPDDVEEEEVESLPEEGPEDERDDQ